MADRTGPMATMRGRALDGNSLVQGVLMCDGVLGATS